VFPAPARLRRPRIFPSRQAFEASAAVARCHLLDDRCAVFAPQNPAAIDAGVFHNDVIAVGNEQVFFYHESAFANPREVVTGLRRRYAARYCGRELTTIAVPARRVPLSDAVRSYVFNSQLVTLDRDRMTLIAPAECRAVRSVRNFLDDLLASGRTPIRDVHFIELRQSMRNGGGPACLRLRVVLTPGELAALPPAILLNETTHAALVAWVQKHYRDRLGGRDLADPQLLEASRRALDELTQLLGLGCIYPFQLE
jgi:succinylarginine dihydrolase